MKVTFLRITDDAIVTLEYADALLAEGTDAGCRVYWGSHGCDLKRGHPGGCLCLSCYDDTATSSDEGYYVGAPPHYGPDTRYYGEDVGARGLPGLTSAGPTPSADPSQDTDK